MRRVSAPGSMADKGHCVATGDEPALDRCASRRKEGSFAGLSWAGAEAVGEKGRVPGGKVPALGSQGQCRPSGLHPSHAILSLWKGRFLCIHFPLLTSYKELLET